MRYYNTARGVFISRPNRFIAHVDIAGQDTVCHVKNTGRCRELLVPGAEVVLEKSSNPARKTQYDLVAVYKNGTLINMDSQAPNALAAEYLPVLFPDAAEIKAGVRLRGLPAGFSGGYAGKTDIRGGQGRDSGKGRSGPLSRCPDPAGREASAGAGAGRG
jgi:hypothetical protein